MDALASQDAGAGIAQIYYWRTTTQVEVDLVLEQPDGQLVPVEIKASRSPRLSDCKGILHFQEEYGSQSRAGLLLHDGDDLRWLTPRVLAAPWWMVC